MSVNLQKGQRVSLSKNREGLSKIMVGLGWDAAEVKKRGLFGLRRRGQRAGWLHKKT